MADATYQPKVYMQQGGDVQVVASGGEVDVEDGGIISYPVTTETTAANLSNFGVSVCGSTLAKKLYKIGAPAAGLTKSICFSVAAATGWVNVSSTGAAFVHPGGSGNKTYLKAVGNGTATLVAADTSNWYVSSHSTTVTVTSSAT